MPLTVDTPTPCYGKGDLFDSLLAFDHAEAKALCQKCPVIEDCKEELKKELRRETQGGRPEGTWAGERVGVKATAKSTRDTQNAAYTLQEARDAHLNYERGSRDDWDVIGHKVYMRGIALRHRYDQATA